MKLQFRHCFIIILGIQACAKPFVGETPIIPYTNKKHPFGVAGSWNHANLQYCSGEHWISGIQANFPRSRDSADPVNGDSVFVARRFTELRIYTGLQSGNSDSKVRVYIFGGGSFGNVNYRENIVQAALPASDNFLNLQHQTGFMTAFSEFGIKVYKGYFELPFKNVQFEIDAPVNYIFHGGVKQVWLNNNSIVRTAGGTGINAPSPVFGMNSEVRPGNFQVYQVGLTWLLSMKNIDMYWDATYFTPNTYASSFLFRIGLGIHMNTEGKNITGELHR